MELGSFLRGLTGGQTLNSAKDRMLAAGAKTHINKLLERYGTVLDIRLNTAGRSLSCTLQLKGEGTAIEIQVHEYALLTEEGKSVLVIDGREDRHLARVVDGADPRPNGRETTGGTRQS